MSCELLLQYILTKRKCLSIQFLFSQLINKNLKLPNPLSGESPYYMIIATAGSNRRHDDEKMNAFLSQLEKEGAIQNGFKESRAEAMKVSTFQKQ